MSTAPPNRETNTTINMTGSISAVGRASGLRAERRRLRPVMIKALDMSGLHCMYGQGEENVVEGGVVHGEARNQAPVRIGGIQQGADLRGPARRSRRSRRRPSGPPGPGAPRGRRDTG